MASQMLSAVDVNETAIGRLNNLNIGPATRNPWPPPRLPFRYARRGARQDEGEKHEHEAIDSRGLRHGRFERRYRNGWSLQHRRSSRKPEGRGFRTGIDGIRSDNRHGY